MLTLKRANCQLTTWIGGPSNTVRIAAESTLLPAGVVIMDFSLWSQQASNSFLAQPGSGARSRPRTSVDHLGLRTCHRFADDSGTTCVCMCGMLPVSGLGAAELSMRWVMLGPGQLAAKVIPATMSPSARTWQEIAASMIARSSCRLFPRCPRLGCHNARSSVACSF